MPQLELTRQYAIEQATEPHWTFHDRAAMSSLEVIKKSAEANGYLDLQWYQRPRVSQRTGGPYTERKLCATYQVVGVAARLMVCWISKGGSVSWKAAFSDDGWVPAPIPALADQPQDPPPTTEEALANLSPEIAKRLPDDPPGAAEASISK